MLLAYKKSTIRVSKFFKAVLPKFIHKNACFEFIKTNVINNQIIYQLYGLIDMTMFYKKANLNAYNSLENIKNHITAEQLKVNVTSNHVVYAHEGYDFVVYLADEYIFILHSKDHKKDKKRWVLDILIYDTKLDILSKCQWDFYKPYYKIYGFYYLRKCKKVVFTFGKLSFSNEVFHKLRGNRRGFNLTDIYVISLTEIKDNRYSYKHVPISTYAKVYVQTKYPDKFESIVETIADYTIDVNKGVLYMVCKFTCYTNHNDEKKVALLEYNLCSNDDDEIFEAKFFNFKIFKIDSPVLVIEDMSGNENILLYLSKKLFRSRGIPKYLPMHISTDFYDFMSNKLFHSEMIFSSHSKPLIRDRYFNRLTYVLAKIEPLKVAVHIPLQEDVITIRSGRNNKLLAVLLMNDLAVIKSEK